MRPNTAKAEWMETKVVNKIIKKSLKAKYPGIKFSVRGDHFSTRVTYFDGPTEKEIEGIADVGGKGFDGMIDLAYSYYHWYNSKTGDIQIAGTSGTVGSGGCVSEFWNEAPSEDYKLVKISCDYINVHRYFTKDGAAKLAAKFAMKHHLSGEMTIKEGYEKDFEVRFDKRQDSENFWRFQREVSLL